MSATSVATEARRLARENFCWDANVAMLGTLSDLLDADTNLKYAVKYLRGAWMCADGSEARAVSWYSKGYYYEAKRRGILDEVGLA